ncbi:MAG: ImuA family protein, partial [Alphaproteobacteria bacterium]
MHDDDAMARDGLARLRRRIATIEGRGILPESAARAGLSVGEGGVRSTMLSPRRGGGMLPFRVARLDACLGGGLRRDGLHEIRGEASRNGAATGFALALAARLAAQDDRPILWIMEAAAGREAGQPYGAGLDRLGLDAHRVVLVSVRTPVDALWVFEEGLRCRGLAAVMAEIRGHPRLLDLTASRRLALRARDSGVMG